MKIAIGADHAGWIMKDAVATVARGLGHDVVDIGTNSSESVDYPDFAQKVGAMVSLEGFDRGILICGTGNGMAISANKVKGVRAALCHNEYTAEYSRRHNDANVLCLGARVIDAEMAKKIATCWLSTAFEGGRHQRRVEKIE